MGERDEGATPTLTRSQAPPPEQVRRVANAAVPGGCAGHGDAEGAGRALPSGCMWPGGGGGQACKGQFSFPSAAVTNDHKHSGFNTRSAGSRKSDAISLGSDHGPSRAAFPSGSPAGESASWPFQLLEAALGARLGAPPTSNATAGRVLFTLHLRPCLLPPLPLLRTHLGPAR